MLTGTTTKEQTRDIMSRLNPNTKTVVDSGKKEIKLCYVTVKLRRLVTLGMELNPSSSLRRLPKARPSCPS